MYPPTHSHVNAQAVAVPPLQTSSPLPLPLPLPLVALSPLPLPDSPESGTVSLPLPSRPNTDEMQRAPLRHRCVEAAQASEHGHTSARIASASSTLSTTYTPPKSQTTTSADMAPASEEMGGGCTWIIRVGGLPERTTSSESPSSKATISTRTGWDLDSFRFAELASLRSCAASDHSANGRASDGCTSSAAKTSTYRVVGRTHPKSSSPAVVMSEMRTPSLLEVPPFAILLSSLISSTIARTSRI